MNTKYILIVVITGLLLMGSFGVFRLTQTNPETISAGTDKLDLDSIRYLPLGDSYTIGQSVNEDQRWPNQLSDAYQPNGKRLNIIANPAVTGYTSQNLIDRELPLVTTLRPDFVTVQIGVNDFVRGVQISEFEKNLNFIVSNIKSKLIIPSNLLLVTIPDFAQTPAGKSFGDPTELTAGVAEFNQIIMDVALRNDVAVADIFTVSQSVADDPNLVAPDGLHPSAKQYEAWTNVIRQKLNEENLPQ